MALIPPKGLLPKIPGTDTGQVIVEKTIYITAEHGPVDISDILGWMYLLAGKNVKKTKEGWIYEKGEEDKKLEKPPVPAKIGGKYTRTDGASMEDYDGAFMERLSSYAFTDLLRDNTDKYVFVPKSKEEMQKYLNKNSTEHINPIVLGYEDFKDGVDGIEYALDVPYTYKLESVSHEVAAKQVIAEELNGNRFEGDHDALHEQINYRAKQIESEYLIKALEALKN